ncbi:putative DNA-binding domain-containing protein [Photobacterium sp. ZSDE20]|uniref:DNA-binding domain-containing protein n=1 Tax=Photobacterium pectinilyticum TaxID=2906793 RepID=A0ABT1MZI4_9GAMM|nr:DNA-binding domain-containing protein [Photobacterium sp. ZSDE20]MCQ1057895.1 putative DNA-binding domain-containing protein [Photobacterium sp. ZSDE20]MDD1822427.1 putative DNA-binding domain-containing protein [Photobacterium sp. ZSDE20]
MMGSPQPKKPHQLHKLQQDFAEALHYRPSPANETVTTGQFAPEQLIQIYRNNFIISLSEVLEASYPCCKAVVGDECFAQLARQHVLAYPLGEGNVTDYGDGFADTISGQPSVIEAVPYLAELAQLEWLVDRASQHAPVSTDFPFEQLTLITEDNLPQLVMEVAEPIYSFDAHYPVASLWQMITDDQVEPIDMNQPESVIIQHRSQGMLVMATTTTATALLHLCQQGRALGDADGTMLAILGELIQQQLFTRIHGLPEGECAC